MADIHINIDDETKQKAQIKALKEKTNLTAVIVNLVKDWIKSK